MLKNLFSPERFATFASDRVTFRSQRMPNDGKTTTDVYRFPKNRKTLGVRWPKRHGVTAPLGLDRSYTCFAGGIIQRPRRTYTLDARRVVCQGKFREARYQKIDNDITPSSRIPWHGNIAVFSVSIIQKSGLYLRGLRVQTPSEIMTKQILMFPSVSVFHIIGLVIVQCRSDYANFWQLID